MWRPKVVDSFYILRQNGSEKFAMKWNFFFLSIILKCFCFHINQGKHFFAIPPSYLLHFDNFVNWISYQALVRQLYVRKRSLTDNSLRPRSESRENLPEMKLRKVSLLPLGPSVSLKMLSFISRKHELHLYTALLNTCKLFTKHRKFKTLPYMYFEILQEKVVKKFVSPKIVNV